MLLVILLPFLCIGVSSVMGDEPKCSRFEFEKHLLEMLVRLEFELSQTNQKLGLTEKTMQMQIEELKQGNRNMTSELAVSALAEETVKREIQGLKQNDQKMTSELAAAALTGETMKMEIEELKQKNRNMTSELAVSALAEETVKREIEVLKQNDQKMTSELAAAALTGETMKMEIEELKQKNRNMTSELAVSALAEETVKREIEELKQNDRKRGTDLETFKDHSTKISQNLNKKLAKEIEDSIQSMELKLANLTTSTSVPRIYFFGTNPEATLNSYRPIFRTVRHNEGDSYDVSTGLFTCRVPGLYHFAFGFTSSVDSNGSCWICKNNNQLVGAHAKGKYNSGSVAAYLNLDVGNTVHIRCSYWSRILHDSSMWYTGALIMS